MRPAIISATLACHRATSNSYVPEITPSAPFRVAGDSPTGLMNEIVPQLAFEGGAAHETEGLDAFDQDVLAALGDADIVRLCRAGGIGLASVVSASFPRLERLPTAHNTACPTTIAAITAFRR